MRSFRSPRKSVIRVTAVAASGVVAMAMLTGCGDDDKNKSFAPPVPTFSIPKLDVPDIDIPDIPSTLPTGTKKPTSSSKPSGGSTSGGPDDTSINRIDLKVGDCVDFDASDKMSKTSCSGPHDAETVGVYELPESMAPTSATFDQDIEDKCVSYIEPVIDRQPNASQLSGTWIFPSPSSWTMDDDRTLQCLVVRQDEAPLTGGKLK